MYTLVGTGFKSEHVLIKKLQQNQKWKKENRHKLSNAKKKYIFNDSGMQTRYLK